MRRSRLGLTCSEPGLLLGDRARGIARRAWLWQELGPSLVVPNRVCTWAPRSDKKNITCFGPDLGSSWRWFELQTITSRAGQRTSRGLQPSYAAAHFTPRLASASRSSR